MFRDAVERKPDTVAVIYQDRSIDIAISAARSTGEAGEVPYAVLR